MEASQTENSQQDNPAAAGTMEIDAEREGLTHQLHVGHSTRANNLSVCRGASPIRWLSNKLLSEIFLYVYYNRQNSHLGPPCQLVLSQVCSTWRQIVYKMPRLWTRLSISIPDEYEDSMRQGRVDQVSFAKAWLARAHPHPVEVSMFEYSPTIAFANLLDAVVPSANRLQTLSLYLPLPNFRSLVDIPAHSMTHLVSVDLSSTLDAPVEVPWTAVIYAFITAPRLTRMHLNYAFPVHLPQFKMPMPWKQLTDIQMEAPLTFEICWNILLHCTNLTSCDLMVAVSRDHMPNMPILANPRLEQLVVNFVGSGNACLFFRPLRLPALTELRIKTLGRCYWRHEIFMEFTLSSPLKLERVFFYHVNITLAELRLFLTHMPSLVELFLHFLIHITSDLFDMLCWREAGAASEHVNVLPKLQRLRVLLFYHLEADKIANMVESRWWPRTNDAAPAPPPPPPHAGAVSRLRYFTVSMVEGYDFDEEPDREEVVRLLRGRVERWRSEGLAVWVGTEDQPPVCPCCGSEH